MKQSNNLFDEALSASDIGSMIERLLASQSLFPDISVQVFRLLDSTNTEAKRYTQSGGRVPAVFLAEEQSAGRGRMGKSFYSPPSTGIYLSLLLEAPSRLSDTVFITSASAVAVLRAIEAVTGIQAQIKWVNDLYYKNRKVCGILAESFAHNGVSYMIVGVGVNLYTAEFPKELSEIAGALLPRQEGLRNRLAARIIAELYTVYKSDDPSWVMRLYRQHSMVLGKQISFTENGVLFRGIARSVDDYGRLYVHLTDGTEKCLASGEISLRPTSYDTAEKNSKEDQNCNAKQ